MLRHGLSIAADNEVVCDAEYDSRNTAPIKQQRQPPPWVHREDRKKAKPDGTGNPAKQR